MAEMILGGHPKSSVTTYRIDRPIRDTALQALHCNVPLSCAVSEIQRLIGRKSRNFHTFLYLGHR